MPKALYLGSSSVGGLSAKIGHKGLLLLVDVRQIVRYLQRASLPELLSPL